jgi:hypothetical protein
MPAVYALSAFLMTLAGGAFAFRALWSAGFQPAGRAGFQTAPAGCRRNRPPEWRRSMLRR